MRLSSDLHTGAKAHTQSRWPVTGGFPPAYKFKCLGRWLSGHSACKRTSYGIPRTHVDAKGHGGPPIIPATQAETRDPWSRLEAMSESSGFD